ncbi:hypothetical protein TrRE_jg5910 [Triparma retinervis]|uniref:SAM-dependent MTase RsmB/NOP-type domain-containing protein n=1 Tax=Triparma retinervis TaxID=2557542 RepID=A0A9W6ZDB0_9STRA|nr:hypothetical protein TrRE_jg5910 [Triparma retinervis]
MDQQVLEHYSKAGVEEGPLNDFLSSTSVPSFRYVRLNPRMNTNETLASLPKPSPVPWLPSSTNFYAIPNRTINTLDPYVDGSLYGMDCSSGAAVAALRLETVNKPVRVLDLCCCPCAKLCMIVDSLEHLSGCEVVGVDISGNRLNVGKKIARKYLKGAACEVRLYQADGTTFPGPADDISASPSLVFDSRAEAQETNQGERKKMNKSAKSRETKRLAELMSSSPPSPDDKFDFVLIDAECSTDGALNQVKHKIKAGKETATDSIREKLMDEESLTSLQLKLLTNGFANLKDGGSLVYSTCSLSENQNENVVRKFLSSRPDANVASVDFSSSSPPPSIPGSLPGTLRFQPTLGPTQDSKSFSGSGFFLCKISKRRQGEEADNDDDGG